MDCTPSGIGHPSLANQLQQPARITKAPVALLWGVGSVALSAKGLSDEGCVQRV